MSVSSTESFTIPIPPARADNPFVDKFALLPDRFRHDDIMFVIRRTCNENLCVYSLNRDPDDHNLLNMDSPVSVYWVEKDAGGNWAETGLNALEKRIAYGVVVAGVDESRTSVEFSIRAVSNRKLHGRLKPNRSRAFTEIQYKWCEIHSIDVKVGSMSLFSLNPVKWIAINGYGSDGNLQRERIEK